MSDPAKKASSIAILIGGSKPASKGATGKPAGQNPYPMHSKLMAALEKAKLPDAADSGATPGDASDDETGEAEEGPKAAMLDFINAVHGKDVAAALEAFDDLQTLCRKDDDAEGAGEHADDEDYITNDDHHGGEGMFDDENN